mmetsp:Transcript_65698/g.186470  ORF Transcript_65698/g.186470 Transcript_65698/m.186470 type:complete len:445 (+) Transcript_65698:1418-2752(+)
MPGAPPGREEVPGIPVHTHPGRPLPGGSRRGERVPAHQRQNGVRPRAGLLARPGLGHPAGARGLVAGGASAVGRVEARGHRPGDRLLEGDEGEREPGAGDRQGAVQEPSSAARPGLLPQFPPAAAGGEAARGRLAHRPHGSMYQLGRDRRLHVEGVAEGHRPRRPEAGGAEPLGVGAGAEEAAHAGGGGGGREVHRSAERGRGDPAHGVRGCAEHHPRRGRQHAGAGRQAEGGRRRADARARDARLQARARRDGDGHGGEAQAVQALPHRLQARGPPASPARGGQGVGGARRADEVLQEGSPHEALRRHRAGTPAAAVRRAPCRPVASLMRDPRRGGAGADQQPGPAGQIEGQKGIGRRGGHGDGADADGDGDPRRRDRRLVAAAGRLPDTQRGLRHRLRLDGRAGLRAPAGQVPPGARHRLDRFAEPAAGGSASHAVVAAEGA